MAEYNGSGVSGYAIVDYNQLEDGYVWQPRIPVNMYKATKLAYNPLIYASINANNTNTNNTNTKTEDDTPEIVKLNKDVEHLVMQASNKIQALQKIDQIKIKVIKIQRHTRSIAIRTYY